MAFHEDSFYAYNQLSPESGPHMPFGHTRSEQACPSVQTSPERHPSGNEVVRSVPVYSRHVFLAFKQPREWPSGKLGSVEAERLPRLLAATIKAAAHRLGGRVQLTVCEADEASDGDALVFPDMKRYKALTVHDLALLVDEVLVSGRERFLSSEPLPKVQLFVCCDPSRGGRCAQVGTPLLVALRAGVQSRGWTEQVAVRACSHAGCKGDAARVLVFSSRGDCSVGHWYGGVGLADVAALLDEHIGAGRIVEHLWRGEMAPPQGHPRPELAHFPGDSSPPQLPSSAGVGALKETEVLTGGEGQQRAASPGGSDGEVDESVLGYSMTASDSSEEGLFSPSGGTDAAGKQGGRSVGASFGSGLFSLESTGGAALMELARSEGASKGGDITSGCGVHNTINSPDVHNECESGVTGMMLRGEGQQEGMLLRRGTKLEVEKRMHATALQGSLSSAKESTWFSFYFSEGVRFDAKVYFGVSVAAIAAIVGFQLVRQH